MTDRKAKGKQAVGTVRVDTVKHFIADAMKSDFFHTVLTGHWEDGGNTKLIVVTGENATGKSFLRRIFTLGLHEAGIDYLALSMQKRTTSLGDCSNTFIYGDESCNATGDCTASSVLGAMRTSLAREEDGKRHAILWDEPDVGLSDSYAAGAALDMVDFLADAPKKLFFAAVTTHRKAMLVELQKHGAHHIRLGDKLTLDEVLAAPVKPRRLQELKDRNISLFRAIHKTYGL